MNCELCEKVLDNLAVYLTSHVLIITSSNNPNGTIDVGVNPTAICDACNTERLTQKIIEVEKIVEVIKIVEVEKKVKKKKGK